MSEKVRVAFIKSRWHADIVDQALKGFTEDMMVANCPLEIVSYDVPGAFEMPLLSKKLAKTGCFDAIVAAALVVDGGIYRHDFVAQAVVSGLMEAQMSTGVPVFSVSLTPHNFQPTQEHHRFFYDHFLKKGAEAAQAVRMVTALALAESQREGPANQSTAPIRSVGT